MSIIHRETQMSGTQMKATYKAVEVSAPGVLRVVERSVVEPGPGQVRIRVEACGICHTDAAKEKPAKDLGAHVYIDTSDGDATAVLQRMGGARAILATGTSGDAMGSLVSGLAVRGKLIVLGVPQDQIQLNAFPLVFGGRSIYGSLTGTPIDNEDTLAFSVLENIRPMIETFPLERAASAYARMMQGKARFRVVLVPKNGIA